MKFLNHNQSLKEQADFHYPMEVLLKYGTTKQW